MDILDFILSSLQQAILFLYKFLTRYDSARNMVVYHFKM